MDKLKEKNFECEDLLQEEIDKAAENKILSCQGKAQKKNGKVFCNKDCPLYRYHTGTYSFYEKENED